MNLAQALISVMGGGGFRLVTSVASSSSSISIPSGGAAGDLLVLLDVAANVSGGVAVAPTASTPSGFTSINNVNGAIPGLTLAMRSILFYQLAASDLSGTSLTVMTGGFRRSLLLVFRGETPFATATLFGAGGEMTNGNPTAQTLAINGQTAPIVALSAFSYGTGRSMTSSTSVLANSGLGDSEIKYRIYTTNPAADLTADTGDVGDMNTLQSCYIQLTY